MTARLAELHSANLATQPLDIADLARGHLIWSPSWSPSLARNNAKSALFAALGVPTLCNCDQPIGMRRAATIRCVASTATGSVVRCGLPWLGRSALSLKLGYCGNVLRLSHLADHVRADRLQKIRESGPRRATHEREEALDLIGADRCGGGRHDPANVARDNHRVHQQSQSPDRRCEISLAGYKFKPVKTLRMAS